MVLHFWGLYVDGVCLFKWKQHKLEILESIDILIHLPILSGEYPSKEIEMIFPFHCDHCDKRFKLEPNLKRHEVIHGQDFGLVFQKEDNDEDANKNVKMETNCDAQDMDFRHPHPCGENSCEKTFLTIMGLKQHMDSAHPETLQHFYDMPDENDANSNIKELISGNFPIVKSQNFLCTVVPRSYATPS